MVYENERERKGHYWKATYKMQISFRRKPVTNCYAKDGVYIQLPFMDKSEEFKVFVL